MTLFSPDIIDARRQRDLIVNVEPGLYFVPAILDDPGRRSRFADTVVGDALERWRPVGVVRIEDNILVTDADPTVLTASIPK